MERIHRDLLASKAASVELLVLDVDGVLTDGRIVYTTDGQQILSFHVHDGLGIKLLADCGVKIAIISARKSSALEKRASELKIDFLYQGVSDKVACLRGLLELLQIPPEKVAAIGDDLVDLPVLKFVGLPVIVKDAAPGMSDHVDYITERSGGTGAVREVCELILKAKKKWAIYFDGFLGPSS